MRKQPSMTPSENEAANAETFKVTSISEFLPPARLLPWAYMVDDSAARGESRVKVTIHEDALEQIIHHAREDMGNERMGILLGSVFTDPLLETHWVEIARMVPAESVDANLVRVDVSAKEIARMNNQIDEVVDESEGKVRKLGWYHTHPGHGIFMSRRDIANQSLVYRADWNIALVVDPHSNKYGFFSGPDCLPVPPRNVRTIPREKALIAASHVETPVVAQRNDPKSGTPMGMRIAVSFLGLMVIALLGVILILYWQARVTQSNIRSVQASMFSDVDHSISFQTRLDPASIFRAIASLDPDSNFGRLAQERADQLVSVTAEPKPSSIIITNPSVLTATPTLSSTGTITATVTPVASLGAVPSIITPSSVLSPHQTSPLTTTAAAPSQALPKGTPAIRK